LGPKFYLQPKEELFFVIKYNKKERELEKLVFSLLKIPLHEREDTDVIDKDEILFYLLVYCCLFQN